MGKIVVVPLSLNLLKTVASDLIKQKPLSDVTVIFPSRRAIVFFQYYLSKMIKKPVVLPELVALEDWIIKLYGTYEAHPQIPVNEYDQAWLVYEAAKEVFEKENSPSFVSTWEEFLPWAFRLVNLFKECDLEFTNPSNVPYPQDTHPRAQILLERIGKIYDLFNRKLAEYNFTTYAKAFRYLAETNITPPSHSLYLVGFYALTEAEDKLFRNLFTNGAVIYWHADPDNLPELYERWRKKWKIEPEYLHTQEKNEPEFFFFEAHDLHSELKELKKRLPDKIIDLEPDLRVIVPFAIENIIPLAYHLPEGPVNLTMGYPLKFTGFYVFTTTLFKLIQQKHPELGYRTETLIEFLKTPYLPDTLKLRQKLLEYGKPYISKEEVLNFGSDSNSKDLEKQSEIIFEQIVLPVENATSTQKLASAFRNIFSTLWKQETVSIYEREFLKTFLDDVLPILEDSLFAEKPMNKRGLFTLVERIISSARVPFEGEPLCGLQIMGPLETRLLSFNEVFLLDVNEGIIPGIEEINPLIPHKLRAAIGLPDRVREELITRYHFERLIYSAKKVHIFWQFQTTRGGESGLEGRKIKSRYVEKLLWEEEKKHKALLNKIKNKINFEESHIEFIPEGLKMEEYLKKNDLHKEKALTLLKNKPVSPTLLQEYIECPLRFFYRWILELKQPEVQGDFAYDQLGTAVHAALEKYFRELSQNKFPAVVKKEDLDIDILFGFFEESIKAQEFYRVLSEEKKFLLMKTARFRLEKYLEKHPKETEILSLERKFEKKLSLTPQLNVRLFGKVDRIDRRKEIYVIIDYKTGKITSSSTKKLLNLDTITDFTRYDDEMLYNISDSIPHIQLPFYIYLFCSSCDSESSIWEQTNAAYVELNKMGEEKFLIAPSKMREHKEDLKNFFSCTIPTLIKYLCLHLLESSWWYTATNARHCHCCDYDMICKYAL